MDNPMFIPGENIPLLTDNDEDRGDDHDDGYDFDYDDYNTPNASRVEDTTFKTPSYTNKQETSTSL